MAPQKVSVMVKYSKPGTKPPIYLAGSFSDPAWQPQEMQHTMDERNEYAFHKEVEVEGGKEYQYKFRVGDGDWWMLNEDSPTVTDDIGNRNNLLAVPLQEESTKISEETTATPIVEGSSSHTTSKTDNMDSIPKDETPSTEQALDQTAEGLFENGGDDTKADSSTGEFSSPTLVVEKIDSEPHHGDDFGTNATTEQKDAHKLHAQDAEPDHVIVRTPTPEMARVAAEVADSAAILDREQPTPPIPDEEAGRIGFRRMSSTPIPEVADTAAEVAGSAAIIDKDEPKLKIELPLTYDADEMEGSLSGQATPWEERVPKFSHECLEPPGIEDQPASQEHFEVKPPYDPYEEVEIDPNDPTIEEFPRERKAILEAVRSSARRMSEDQVSFEGVPHSPVVGANHHSERVDFPSPSPHILAKNDERSPSLDSIPEEHGYQEELLTKLPSAVGQSNEKADYEGIGNGTAEDSNDEDSDGHVKEKSSDLTSEGQMDGSFISPNPVQLPVTPFVHDNSKQLGGEPDNSPKIQQIITSPAGPSIVVQPATPATSLLSRGSDPFNGLIDTAKATAIEEENIRTQLTSRKSIAPSEERPLTPTSMRSAGKDAKSKNFLKSFLKLVFVDWIGGLIMRLCGGGRHT